MESPFSRMAESSAEGFQYDDLILTLQKVKKRIGLKAKDWAVLEEGFFKLTAIRIDWLVAQFQTPVDPKKIFSLEDIEGCLEVLESLLKKRRKLPDDKRLIRAIRFVEYLGQAKLEEFQASSEMA